MKKIDPADRKRLLKGLTLSQKHAVAKTLKNPSLVIAGAGSGKTTVFAKRIAYLLAKDVKPWRILAFTFTNKAAKEMKERIAKMVGDEEVASKVNAGTFHSLAVRWLHRYHAEAGLKKNWTSLDDDDTSKLIKSILKDLGMDNSAATVRAIKGRISDLKNALITPSRFKAGYIQNNGDRDTYRVYAEYQRRMQRQNAIDFDDMIMKMVMMLENDPAVRKEFQAKYKFVMVDEYQDTNKAQYKMIKLITGDNNIFVVGDDYQGIYGWRGAEIENILNFENDYSDPVVVKLEQNFRSTQTIVNAGNAIMKHNPNQMEKTCFSNDVVGEKIKWFTAADDEMEARFIAEEIENLVTHGGHSYSDIAILYRTNVQSRQLEDKLMVARIPYNMVSGFSFYSRAEVKDTLSWIQVSVNPDNDLAVERILKTVDGIGKTTIEAMVNAQKKASNDPSLYDVVERYTPRQTKTKAALATVTQVVSRLNAIYEAGKNVSDTPITDMLELIFKYTGYVKKLQDDGSKEALDRIDNIKELQKIAKGYEESTQDPDIQEFLDQIALASQTEKIGNGDQVQMMTLHSAKGLEYPIVFLIGMEEGLLPHANSLAMEEDVEEERRLCYVGVTRAKHTLYITNAQRRMGWDRVYKWQTPSRFLDEIPSNLVEVV